jgi:mannose-6-phosphate isomerase-like protein (cupin superfamily)
MQHARIADIAGTVFPAGRHTRVLVGDKAPLAAKGFCMGQVTIFPGGQVPAHDHVQEEVYYVLQGEGEIEIEGAAEPIRAGDAVYVPSGKTHNLRNPGKRDMTFIFVYSPAGVVDHWKQEMEGKLT